MKQKNISLIIAIGMLLGLGVGYFLFRPSGEKKDHASHSERMDGAETIWTCSMHPQIRRTEPGLCPICEMDLIPLGTGNNSGNPLELQMTPEAIRLANIQTTLVKTSQAGDSRMTLSGKVQENERNAASLVAHIPGRIEKLFVTFEGEQVQKGQRVATIFSPTLIAAQRELLEAQKLQDINPALLEATRNKLRFWKVPESLLEQVEKSGEIQETFTLFADVPGVVNDRRVSVGDYVSVGDPLFNLIGLQSVWVLFDAYEENLADVKLGQSVVFTVPAIPGREFKSTISFVDPRIDPLSRVAHLRAEVPNPGGILKPEMLVSGSLETVANGNSALVIPKSALLWTGERSVVFVELEERTIPTFEFREVRVGADQGLFYEILSGLKVGERVVSNGAFMIDAAAQLNNQFSMINRIMEAPANETPDFKDVHSISFRIGLESLGAQYLTLKDQLVLSDPEKSSQAAAGFLGALEKVPMEELRNAAHVWWMSTLGDLEKHANQIKGSRDLEIQRRQFSFLSLLLIQTFEAFGLEGKTFYVQHCPMVFDNEGADWLAVEKEINNPYFGDKMLHCGSVTEVIKPAK
ncbi:MAG: efflux RND transporter periplasmic adaptor subunit [Saprospiraceae bacterium]|nr:efflux RND transporter periplasmic adaptor subunit [Saprospiraceae bacterium]